MKVKIEIEDSALEPYAVIYTRQITDEIQHLADVFKLRDSPVTALLNEKQIILQPNEIYMVRVENGETVIYDYNRHYISKKRLYELKEQFGNQFMQISKNTIVNVAYLDSVEAGFNGTLLLKLKNDCRDYVSRKYLPETVFRIITGGLKS